MSHKTWQSGELWLGGEALRPKPPREDGVCGSWDGLRAGRGRGGHPSHDRNPHLEGRFDGLCRPPALSKGGFVHDGALGKQDRIDDDRD